MYLRELNSWTRGRKVSNPKKHILVIGDAIIDESIHCKATGLSLETPTLKSTFEKREISYGGAANVVNNLLHLGCTVTYIFTKGVCEYSGIFNQWKDDNLNLISFSHLGPSTVKTRFWIGKGIKKYKYLQVNRGEKYSLEQNTMDQLKDIITSVSPDLVALDDYKLGMLDNRGVVQNLITFCKQKKITIVSSSQISDGNNHYDYFKGSDMICMNEEEASRNGFNGKAVLSEELKKMSDRFMSNICVTFGEKGSAMACEGGQYFRHKGYVVDASDTCGAGDAFLAALCTKYDSKDLNFCNKWAAASTLTIGTEPPNIEVLNEL